MIYLLNKNYSSCCAWVHLDWRKICHRWDTPTSLPNALCACVCRLWHMRLTAPLYSLQPSILMPPNWRWRGCMWVGRATSEAGEAAAETGSNACFSSFAAGSETSGTASPGSWGGGWEIVVDGVWQTFLDWGWAKDMEGCNVAPLRSLKRLSASEPATATSIFPNPAVSRCWASSSNGWASSFKELTLFNRSSP